MENVRLVFHFTHRIANTTQKVTVVIVAALVSMETLAGGHPMIVKYVHVHLLPKITSWSIFTFYYFWMSETALRSKKIKFWKRGIEKIDI